MGAKKAYKLLMIADENNEIDVSKAHSMLRATPSTIRKYLHQLILEGFVEKTEDGKYVLTRTGVSLRKSVKSILSEEKVPSYIVTDTASGQPLPLSFSNYEQLWGIINYELAPKQLLEEHFKKYMEEWIRNSVKDEFLAEKIAKGEIQTIDDLKKYLEFILSVKESLRNG